MDGHSSRSSQVWKSTAFVGGLTELTGSAQADCCERLQCSGSFKIPVSWGGVGIPEKIKRGGEEREL